MRLAVVPRCAVVWGRGEEGGGGGAKLCSKHRGEKNGLAVESS